MPFDDVAEAVSVASDTEQGFYVERVDRGYRWSFVHPGGRYPLLRIAAMSIGFRTVAEAVCVLCADADAVVHPERWTVVEFD